MPRRPPPGNHPLHLPLILAGVAVMAFLAGALLVLLLAVILEFFLYHPVINPLSSSFLANLLRKTDSALVNPWLGTLMVAGGIAASLWAARIAWKTLWENTVRPEGSTPAGRDNRKS